MKSLPMSGRTVFALFAFLAICITLTPLPLQAAVKEADDHIIVEVAGRGSAPLKGNPAMARKTALLLAKRDAAEKALGASVAVEMLPDKRKVKSAVEGSLTYDIMETTETDRIYSVTIMARLAIPRELVESFPLPDDQRDTDSGLRPLLERFPSGEINWQDGYILAFGIGKITGRSDEHRLAARRAAIVDAQAKALEIAGGIRVDAESQVEGLLADDERLSYRVEGLIRDGRVMDEEPGEKIHRVTLKVPLNGVQGLSLAFYNQVLRELTPPPDRQSAAAQGPYTGLVLDARGTGLKAALFPNVISKGGASVYSAALVDSDAFLKRGVAGYSTGENGPEMDAVGENPLFIRVVMAGPVDPGLLVGQAEEQPKKKRRRKRQGSAPLKIKGLESGGTLKANVVISDTDAARIANSGEFARIFRKSRVIILTDPVIGGTEGNEAPGNRSRLAAR
jgi:hypothetical protein